VDTDIRVERSVAAPPEAVYRYLTDGHAWARWQGAKADLEAMPGGRWSMTMPGGQRVSGSFTELVENRRVVFTWGWEGHPTVPPGSSTVTIELVPAGSGTIVVLTHSGLPPDEIGVHRVGWDHYLPRLRAIAQGEDPGPDRGPADSLVDPR
jgi:uncharacterized protein YndB with AHSA1/START domain